MSSNVLTVFDYPVFLNLADVDVLVVGGGRIGLRKVAGLARRRAAIHAAGQSTEDIDWAVIIDDALGPADGALSASDGAQPEAGPHCLSSAKA